MIKLYGIVDKARKYLLISISAFTIVLCFVQIILRYFTFLSFRPFAWGDEVLRLSAIWVIFLGISIGVRRSAHFSVTYCLDKIKDKKKKMIVERINDGVVVSMFAVLVFQGCKYTFSNTTSMLQNVPISMAWFYASIPAGCLLCIFEYLYKFAFGDDYNQVVLPKKEA